MKGAKSITYTLPKIKDRNGDLTKRWFVSYSYRHPATGKLKRFQEYGDINKQQTKVLRQEHARALHAALVELLKNGYNPFARYEPDIVDAQKLGVEITIETAIDDVLRKKKIYLKKSSYSSLKSCLTQFKAWLKIKGLQNMAAHQVKRAYIVAFLDYTMQQGAGPRTRNNHLGYLLLFFNALIETELCNNNPALKIRKLAAPSLKNKIYNTTQLAEIREYIIATDPQLHLFIQFVTYAFLRPVEVCRLRIKDINTTEKCIYVNTKTKRGAMRLLIDKLADALHNASIHTYSQTLHVFTPKGVPGVWIIDDNDKRDYFSKRFLRVKKHFNLGAEFGIYSFRHTFITDLYRSYRLAGMAEHDIRVKLMGITGHQTIDALQKYLRDIQAVLPEDYGNDFNINF